jgi:hypothetical protein
MCRRSAKSSRQRSRGARTQGRRRVPREGGAAFRLPWFGAGSARASCGFPGRGLPAELSAVLWGLVGLRLNQDGQLRGPNGELLFTAKSSPAETAALTRSRSPGTRHYQTEHDRALGRKTSARHPGRSPRRLGLRGRLGVAGTLKILGIGASTRTTQGVGGQTSEPPLHSAGEQPRIFELRERTLGRNGPPAADTRARIVAGVRRHLLQRFHASPTALRTAARCVWRGSSGGRS